jgi:large subunit ribosomal protein L29
LKDEELDKRLSELKLEFLKEQGNVKMGRPIKNPGKIKQMRRTIARILTIKKEREREGKK